MPILSDLEFYVTAGGVLAVFLLYWLAVTRAMRRELKEIEEECVVPEGWDAMRISGGQAPTATPESPRPPRPEKPRRP